MSAASKSLGRFIIVGLTATFLHYVILKTSLGLGTALPVANLAGFVGSFIFTYLGNRFFVFDGKSSHAQAAGLMIVGYIGFALFHTSGMVGFTNGAIYGFFSKTIAGVGGTVLSGLWEWVATALPSRLAALLFTPHEPGKLTTSFSFLIVTGMTTIMSYCWNRFVVFKLRETVLPTKSQKASASTNVQ